MKKKFIKYSLLVLLALAVIWSIMAITDYYKCKSLKEPIFVRPVIVTENKEGVWEGIGYKVEIRRQSETDKELITEMTYMLFGSGVIKAELVDGQIKILNYNWSAAFIH